MLTDHGFAVPADHAALQLELSSIDNLGTTPCDWRRALLRHRTTTPCCSTLAGSLNLPGSSHLHDQLQRDSALDRPVAQPVPDAAAAGRIKYYGSIPTAITGSWPSYGSTDQRFWVEFIDYVLGFRQTSAGVYQDISAMAGYGSDFTWGTMTPSPPPPSRHAIHELYGQPGPAHAALLVRPASLMVDYLQNYNM